MNESVWASPRTLRSTAIDMALVIDITLIVIIWCASSAIVNPIGNFPLNDDWAYGLMVEHLLETGDYRPLKWALAPSVTNVLWGALFCLPGGFSFTVLRLSTLVASLFGLIGIYILVRDLQQPRWFALLVAFTLGFNSIYFALSHTFMTDAPFTAISIWSVVLLARSLKNGSDSQMLMGTVLAFSAILSRQLALCIPLAFAVTSILKWPVTRRNLVRAFSPLFFCVVAFFAFKYWLATSGRVPTFFDEKSNDLLKAFTSFGPMVKLLFDNFFTYMVYLGLFLLPVLLVSMGDLFRSHVKRGTAAVCAGILLVAGGVTFRVYGGKSILLPFMYNIIAKSGVGPLTLRDTFVLKLDHMPALPVIFWIIVTAMGLVGAVLLIAKISFHAVELMRRILCRGRIAETEFIGTFMMFCGVIYLLPLLVALLPFDRYLIPVVAFFAVGIVGVSAKLPDISFTSATPLRFVAFSVLAAFSLFAISSTRDYLAWNRIRWMALEDLTRNGRVDARDIDGGFEFNGLYLYDPDLHPDYKRIERSWWWVYGDTYQISFDVVPGYMVSEEYTYKNWLPPHDQKVLVLKKVK